MEYRLQSTDLEWDEAVSAFLRHKKRADKCKERTVEYYDNQLRLLIDWARGRRIPLQDMRERDFREYMASREGPCGKHDQSVCRECRTVSKATQRHDVICARSFFEFCFGERIIDRNPAASFPLPDAPRPKVKKPTYDELMALLEGMQRRWDEESNDRIKHINPESRNLFMSRNLAIVAGVITTGCRISEMLELKYANFDRLRETVAFEETKTTHLEDGPVVKPFEPEWLSFLDPWLKARRIFIDKIKRRGGQPREDLMFLSALGGPIHPDVFGKSFRGYKEFAGVFGFSLHGLRHYTATRVAQNNVMGAKGLLGHKDLKTTLIYAHDELEHVRVTQRDAAPLRALVKPESKEAKPRRRRYA
jgi:site-specific recombinase XerD